MPNKTSSARRIGSPIWRRRGDEKDGFVGFEEFFEDGFGGEGTWATFCAAFEIFVMDKGFADDADVKMGIVHLPDLAGLQRLEGDHTGFGCFHGRILADLSDKRGAKSHG
jgi:hypothetical protein